MNRMSTHDQASYMVGIHGFDRQRIFKHESDSPRAYYAAKLM